MTDEWGLSSTFHPGWPPAPSSPRPVSEGTISPPTPPSTGGTQKQPPPAPPPAAATTTSAGTVVGVAAGILGLGAIAYYLFR